MQGGFITGFQNKIGDNNNARSYYKEQNYNIVSASKSNINMDYSLVVGHEHGGTVGSTRNFLNGINNIVGGGDHGKSTSGALAEFNTNQSLVVGTNNTFYRDSNGDNDSNIVGGYANVLKNARLNLVVGEQNTLNSGSNIAFSGAKGNLVGGYSNDIYQGSNYNIIAGQNNTLSSSSNGSSALINSIIAGTGVANSIC